MKMLPKIFDGKSLEISQENAYDKFLSLKLQTYSVESATLLLR